MCKSNFKATKMKSFPAKSKLWLVWWTCWLNMEMQIVFLLFHWPPCLVSCIYANAPFQYPLIRSQTAAWHCVFSLMSFIILWALPYWKIREHVNLVGWPVIYNIHYCAYDEAFNFYIVCRASVCRFNTSLEWLTASCYHTILYVFHTHIS